jgi:POT family proton-dependent oligopeptide transporter
MSDNVKQSHPKGLYVLFITEMWERFSYYGMRAIFILFLTKALLYDKAFASSGIYGSYTGLVYLTPLIGGYIADRFWGNRRSIIVGGLVMALGQFLMFMSGTLYLQVDLARTFMLSGLCFLIIGNGFFKPNISTMVGQLYPKGDNRIDAAFTVFYMGINLGAFFAPLVCGALGDTGDPADFRYGFLAAGAGMIISVITFVLLKDKYIVTPEGVPIGTVPKKKEKVALDPANVIATEYSSGQVAFWLGVEVVLFSLLFFVCKLDIIGSFIFSLCVSAPGFVISDRTLTKEEKDRIWVIYIAAFFVIFFWAAFEQAGNSLTFFAEEQTNRLVGSIQIPASFFQSINAVAIVIFAPLFALLWQYLGKRRAEPSSPIKLALGLFLLAVGYMVISLGVHGLDPSIKVSMLWLFSLYGIHTFGELCLSPIGLAMVNKLAPVKVASLLMGIWFLSNAAANKASGILAALYPEEVRTEISIDLKSKNLSRFALNTSGDTLLVQTASDSVKLVALNTGNIKTVAPNARPDLVAVPSGTKDINAFKIKLSLFVEERPKVTRYRRLLTSDPDQYLDVEYEHSKKKDTTRINTLHTYSAAAGKKLLVLKSNVSKDGVKNASLKVVTLFPEKPTFLSMKIENLYDFFMIFVYMAGGASIVLFFLAGRLKKMMHGVV